MQTEKGIIRIEEVFKSSLRHVYKSDAKHWVTRYKESQGDHNLFVKHTASGEITVLQMYVNDIIITRNDEKVKETLKNCLAKEFEIKDLRRMKYFLGIEVACSRQDIFIFQ